MVFASLMNGVMSVWQGVDSTGIYRTIFVLSAIVFAIELNSEIYGCDWYMTVMLGLKRFIQYRSWAPFA